MPSSRGASQPRVTSLMSPAPAGRFFATSAAWEACIEFVPDDKMGDSTIKLHLLWKRLMKEKDRMLLVSGEYTSWPLAVMVSNFAKPSFTPP